MAGEDELDDLLEVEDDEPKGEKSGIRQYLEELKKKNNQLEREVQKAEERGRKAALQEVSRKQSATEIATTLGNPKAADLFLRLNPDTDPTTENMQEFVSSYGLVTSKPEEAPEETTPKPALTPEQMAQAANFTAVGGGAAATERMTNRELKEKIASGELTQDDAMRAIREGRVEGPDGRVIAPRTRIS